MKLLFLLMALAQLSIGKPIKVFILSGQSNMVGQGKVEDIYNQSEFPNYRNEYPNITLFCALNGDSLVVSDRLKPGNSGMIDLGGIEGNNTFGPELGIAKVVSGRYPGDALAFIKVAWGATYLETHWLKNQPFGCGPHATDSVYSWFIHNVKHALNQLSELAGGYELNGIFWMQGENDGIDKNLAMRYSHNLRCFVDSVLRVDLSKYPNNGSNKGKLPFVYGRIHNEKIPSISMGDTAWNFLWPYGDTVQMEQYRAQFEIQQAGCTDASITAPVWAFGRPDALMGFGPPHYNTLGALQVGQGLGEAFLNVIDGKTDCGCKNADSSPQKSMPTVRVNNTIEIHAIENPLALYSILTLSFSKVVTSCAYLKIYTIGGIPVRTIRLYFGQDRLTISRRFLVPGCYVFKLFDGSRSAAIKMVWNFKGK